MQKQPELLLVRIASPCAVWDHAAAESDHVMYHKFQLNEIYSAANICIELWDGPINHSLHLCFILFRATVS